MAFLAHEEGLTQFPLFVDYGQLNKEMEQRTCLLNFRRYGLPIPKVVNLSGFGALLSSGLTDSSKRILEDAFLPCRNLLFITVAAGYAYQCGASAVAIGLLNDAFSLFPDQTKSFVWDAEALISKTLGQTVCVLTPLMTFSKAEVLAIAKEKGIDGTYSCHAGTDPPCGKCIACREYSGLEV
jgi:7-cyano-7-deazaguanine synthase